MCTLSSVVARLFHKYRKKILFAGEQLLRGDERPGEPPPARRTGRGPPVPEPGRTVRRAGGQVSAGLEKLKFPLPHAQLIFP